VDQFSFQVELSPFTVVAGLSADAMRAKALNWGCTDYLAKCPRVVFNSVKAGSGGGRFCECFLQQNGGPKYVKNESMEISILRQPYANLSCLEYEPLLQRRANRRRLHAELRKPRQMRWM
jgi:hypothetical protein